MSKITTNRRCICLSLLLCCAFALCGEWLCAAPSTDGQSGVKLASLGLRPDEIISMDQLKEKVLRREPVLIFDARSKRSYDGGHIRGARLPLTKEYYRREDLFGKGLIRDLPDRDKSLAERTAGYAKDVQMVTYCSDGCQAGVVLLFTLKRLGFKNVQVLDGGLQAWEQKGFPISLPVAGKSV